MIEIFANLATTTLAGPISAGALSVNLAAGTGALFPNPTPGASYFLLTFQDAATGLVHEIVQVTARSTDTCTIVRGQEGTTAAAWLAGDLADNRWTAGSAAIMVQVAQLQQQAGNFATDSGSANAYVGTLNPVPSSLAFLTGVPIRVKIATTNTGNSTLTVNGLATTVIKNPDLTTLAPGQLVAGSIVEFKFDGTQFQLAGPVSYHPGFSNMQAFTSSGTFTVPAGVTKIKVRVWGGGGGGGGVNGTAQSSGGSGGGYSEGIFAVTPGAVLTVTIGAGGAGGNGTPTNGTSGGTTSVTGCNSATGGGPGSASSSGGQSTTTSGGSGSGGTINLGGTSGSGSITNGGGSGGGSPLGAPSSPVGSIGGTGSGGSVPGGAGAGTANIGAGGFAGGAGGAGMAIIEY